MRHYRIYSLNEKGRFLWGRDAECPDDATALAEAKTSSQSHAVEVWEGGRMVALLDCQAARAAG